MMDSKTAIPAQSCIEADGYDTSDWVQRALNYYDIRGAVQALPFNMSSPVLYFNRTAFTAAGLDPANPPADLAALQAAAAKVTASGAKKYGIALESGTNSGGGWFVEQFAAKANQLYVNNENGRAERATEAVFDTPEGAANLGVLGQMVTAGTAVYVGENTSGQDSLLRLVAPQENAAMAIASSAFLGGAINLAKAGTFQGFSDSDLGVGAFPGPAGDGGVVIGGAALWLVKGKGDEKTAATWDYMKFLTSPEAQSTWAAKTGYVPIRQSAVDLDPVKSVYAADPRFKVAYDQLLTGEETPATAGGVAGPLRQIRTATATAVRSVLEGGDAAAALKTAADEADKQIADYNKRVGA
jgi:sn-glycerol 3-phosphate transport system substrate-binding protein